MTLDLPDDLVLRLWREAERRSMGLDALVSEPAYRLPALHSEAGDERRLGFFALGASTDGRGAANADEILATDSAKTHVLPQAPARSRRCRCFDRVDRVEPIVFRVGHGCDRTLESWPLEQKGAQATSICVTSI